MLSTGTEEPTTAPFPAGLHTCAVQGLNEDPLLFEVFFYMSMIFICLIYVENIFSHMLLTVTSLVSFFLYGNCALLCLSNKNLNFFNYLARLKLHRAIILPRNRSENFKHWK